MKLYVKTPFDNDNKYLPHLIEHCVLFSPEFHSFLNIYNEVEASTLTGCTIFEFHDSISEKLIIKKIQGVLNKSTIELQKKVLKSEFKNISYGQKLYEKILQKIMKNLNIKTNSVQNISIDKIIKYHKNWYQKKNMILVDNDNKLFLKFGLGTKLKSNSIISKIPVVEHNIINYKKDKYDLIFTKYKTPYDILFLDFFESFVNTLLFYNATFKGKFFFDPIDISLTDSLYILTIEKGRVFKKISHDSFEQFKKYFIEQIGHNKMRSYIPQIALFTGYFVSIEQHKKYIKTIDIKDIEKICQLLS